MHPSHTSTPRAVLVPGVRAWKSGAHALMVLLALTGIVYAGASRTFPAPTQEGAGATHSLHADPSAALAQRPPYVPGEILVRFTPETKHATMAAAHTLAGASEVQSFSVVPNLRRVSLTRDHLVPETLARYRQRPDVLYAERLYTVRAVGLPHDLSLPDQQRSDGLSAGSNSPVHALGSPTNDPLFPKNLFQIDAPGAWNITTGSKSVVVAVIGTGVDYNHEDLRANMWRNPGEIPGNGRDDDGNGYPDDIYGINTVNNTSDPMDDGVPGYGTHEAARLGPSAITASAWSGSISRSASWPASAWRPLERGTSLMSSPAWSMCRP